MRALLVTRAERGVPMGCVAALELDLAAWRAAADGAWERFAFSAAGGAGLGVVRLPDAAALRRLVETWPLAPFGALVALEVEPGPPAGAGEREGLALLAVGAAPAAAAARLGLRPAAVRRLGGGGSGAPRWRWPRGWRRGPLVAGNAELSAAEQAVAHLEGSAEAIGPTAGRDRPAHRGPIGPPIPPLARRAPRAR